MEKTTWNKSHLQQSPENMSPLAGGGAYCVGRTTGRTACYILLFINTSLLQFLLWL